MAIKKCRFRKWFRSLLVERGGLFSDVFRSKHPGRCVITYSMFVYGAIYIQLLSVFLTGKMHSRVGHQVVEQNNLTTVPESIIY